MALVRDAGQLCRSLEYEVLYPVFSGEHYREVMFHLHEYCHVHTLLSRTDVSTQTYSSIRSIRLLGIS